MKSEARNGKELCPASRWLCIKGIKRFIDFSSSFIAIGFKEKSIIMWCRDSLYYIFFPAVVLRNIKWTRNKQTMQKVVLWMEQQQKKKSKDNKRREK